MVVKGGQNTVLQKQTEYVALMGFEKTYKLKYMRSDVRTINQSPKSPEVLK